MTQVTLRNLTKEYADTTAVNGIDLEVRDGDFLVLVGPSGCGKSTTLRMISGLEQPTGGDILIGDERVNERRPEDRNISMVFQNYALYPHMTARKNITFGMTDAGDYSPEEINRRVNDVAETLEITELLDRKPGELSGGEQQRVALGRSLVRDPDILLMDEPLSNLDAKLRVQMRAELAQLHEEFETTTIYVTHDQVEAMTLGDRVAVMNDGQIEQVDPPQELYERPKRRFVAEFIGNPSMNLIPVNIDAHGSEAHATWDDQRVKIPQTPGSDIPNGRALLGIRPETFSLVEEPSEFTIELDVRVTEALGDNLLVHGDTGNVSIRVQLPPRANVGDGERYLLECNPRRFHLFDAETGDVRYQPASEPREERSSVPQAED